MIDHDSLIGAYSTPDVTVGDVLFCEARREDVIVVGFTKARIPWPLGRKAGFSARGPVVYAGLAEAVRRESSRAVEHHFGVSQDPVRRWRRALGVSHCNEGTRRLKVDNCNEEWFQTVWAKSQLPEFKEKGYAKQRGQKRPRRRGLKGHAADWRPNGRAWTAHDDKWVRRLSIDDAVRRTRRTRQSVLWRRQALGVARTRQRRPKAA